MFMKDLPNHHRQEKKPPAFYYDKFRKTFSPQGYSWSFLLPYHMVRVSMAPCTVSYDGLFGLSPFHVIASFLRTGSRDYVLLIFGSPGPGA